MQLETLVEIAQEGPWCATRPCERPWLHPSLNASWDHLGARTNFRRAHSEVSPHEIFGPEPDPWRLGAIEIGLYGAIALHQLANRISGAVGEQVGQAARVLFEESCGKVPLSGLIWLLLHHAPPQPAPWLSRLIFACEMLAFAQAVEQQGLAAAARRQISLQLEEFSLAVEIQCGRAAA